MNRIFKVIWSKVNRQFIAVGETARSATKQRTSRKRLKPSIPSLKTPALLLGAIWAQAVLADPIASTALPTDPHVVSGSADFQAIENQLTIQQNTNQLITNWSSFNIGRDASVNFIQPSASSSALNYVQSMDPSYIFGSLTANGQVILVNPSGIQFGPGGRFDGSSFIGSTLNINQQDYLNGQLNFFNSGSAQSILNEGSLNAFANGTIALIAPQITNLGTIVSPSGSSALLSGDRVNLALEGNRLIRYSIDQGTLNSLIENQSAIQATEGAVILSAKGVSEVSRSVINSAGIIEAQGIVTDGGKVFLDGDQVTQSGQINVSSTKTAGKIQITGDDIHILGTADLLATGDLGGGQILIGGSWQNSIPTIRQAINTTIDYGANLDASATINGNGGMIVAWSDIKNPISKTTVNGALLAKGGNYSGNGGNIETSGYFLNLDNSFVSTASFNGIAGTWLLDPYSIYIGPTRLSSTSGSTTTVAISSGTGTFNGTDNLSLPSTGYSALSTDLIYTALANNALVTLAATNDINLAGDLNYTGVTSSLKLEAPTISLGGNISTTNALDLIFGANDNSDNIFLTQNVLINSGGGDITFYGNMGGAKQLSVDSGTGDINLNSITGNFSGSYWDGTYTFSTVSFSISFPNNTASYIDFTKAGTAEQTNGTISGGSLPRPFTTTGNTYINLPIGNAGTAKVYYDDGTNSGNLASGGAGNSAGVMIPGGKTVIKIEFTTATGNSVTVATDSQVRKYNSTAISSAARVDSLSFSSLGTITLRGNISSTSTQTYSGATTLSGGNRTLTGSTINLGSTLAGGTNGLTISGALDLDGAATGLTTLSVSGTSNLGADVTSTSTQTYSGATTLSGGNRTLTGSTINLGSTLAGGTNGLTISGALDLDGAATGLTTLSVSGTSNLGAAITTSGNQTYTGISTISNIVTLTSSGSGNISFSNKIDGPGQDLTINTSGLTSFGNNIGDAGALKSITTNNPGTLSRDGITVAATTQTFGEESDPDPKPIQSSNPNSSTQKGKKSVENLVTNSTASTANTINTNNNSNKQTKDNKNSTNPVNGASGSNNIFTPPKLINFTANSNTGASPNTGAINLAQNIPSGGGGANTGGGGNTQLAQNNPNTGGNTGGGGGANTGGGANEVEGTGRGAGGPGDGNGPGQGAGQGLGPSNGGNTGGGGNTQLAQHLRLAQHHQVVQRLREITQHLRLAQHHQVVQRLREITQHLRLAQHHQVVQRLREMMLQSIQMLSRLIIYRMASPLLNPQTIQ